MNLYFQQTPSWNPPAAMITFIDSREVIKAKLLLLKLLMVWDKKLILSAKFYQDTIVDIKTHLYVEEVTHD